MRTQRQEVHHNMPLEQSNQRVTYEGQQPDYSFGTLNSNAANQKTMERYSQNSEEF